MTSSDGRAWTSQNGQPGAWNDVVYGGGVYVAVSSYGTGAARVMKSTDGMNWSTATTVPATMNWMGVAYGNGMFAAVADAGSGGTQRAVVERPGRNHSPLMPLQGEPGLTWSMVDQCHECGPCNQFGCLGGRQLRRDLLCCRRDGRYYWQLKPRHDVARRQHLDLANGRQFQSVDGGGVRRKRLCLCLRGLRPRHHDQQLSKQSWALRAGRSRNMRTRSTDCLGFIVSIVGLGWKSADARWKEEGRRRGLSFVVVPFEALWAPSQSLLVLTKQNGAVKRLVVKPTCGKRKAAAARIIASRGSRTGAATQSAALKSATIDSTVQHSPFV